MREKQNKAAMISLLCAGVFFAGSAIYTGGFVEVSPLIRLAVFQNLVLSAGAFGGGAWIWKRAEENSRVEATFHTLVKLSKDGECKEEISLDDSVSIALWQAAVMNQVQGNWYLEVLPDTLPVGLRRETDSFIYRLKVGMRYPLQQHDMIYMGNEKIWLK